MFLALPSVNYGFLTLFSALEYMYIDVIIIIIIILHPKNKLLLYHRYVLSKVSWHFTVADLSKTWVIENLDNLVSKYIRQWLDLSATLTSIVLSKNQFGLDLQLPSVKFTQCQTFSRNALRTSPNTNIQA